MPGNDSPLGALKNECVFSTADRKDAFEITKLVNLSFRGDSSKEGWTTEADLLQGQRVDYDRIIEIIETPGNCIHLLRRSTKRELIACSHLEIHDDHIYLGMLSVLPTLQSQGLGRQLIERAEGQAKIWGLAKVRMSVIAQPAELIAWYEKQGYVRTSERKPFPYGNPRFGLPQRDDLYFIVLEKQL